jgi:hypothetical protein
LRRDIDALEQCPRFSGIKHWRLSDRDDMSGPAHCMRRIDRHDLTVDQPIEQVSQRCEPLDRGRGQLARRSLDPRRNMHRTGRR